MELVVLFPYPSVPNPDQSTIVEDGIATDKKNSGRGIGRAAARL
jgi:hypothetical protein